MVRGAPPPSAAALARLVQSQLRVIRAREAASAAGARSDRPASRRASGVPVATPRTRVGE